MAKSHYSQERGGRSTFQAVISYDGIPVSCQAEIIQLYVQLRSFLRYFASDRQNGKSFACSTEFKAGNMPRTMASPKVNGDLNC